MTRGPRRARALRAAAFLLAAAVFGAVPAVDVRAEPPGGAAALVEKEFQVAIKTVTPATVFITPKGKDSVGSSGVLVTKSGWILTDGAAGEYVTVLDPKAGKTRVDTLDVVEVRVPDLKHGTSQVYTGKVVKRAPDIDSAIVKVDVPPAAGFSFVVPRSADDLHVGSFTFAMGTSFGHAEGGAASLTAGIVSALVRAPESAAGAGAGRNLEIISSAAVNPGVNGGPLVDSEGALVGIVSSWGQLDEKNPYQLLAKAFPIDRIRAAYRGDPALAGVFSDSKPPPPRSKQSDLLEEAIALAARAARSGVASLEIARKTPFSKIVVAKTPRGEVTIARYAGPVSGVVVSDDGYVVTSLYNLGNVLGLANGGGPGRLEQGLAEITGVVVHFPGGPSAPATLVAQDQQIGIALYKAALPEGKKVVPISPGVPEAVHVGRLVLCLGNPYGALPAAEPLTTVGILSRIHPPDADGAWRGDFQTDAAVTDANCGGAMVDVHGQCLGLATLWNPAMTGRSSGIGFGIPWERIAAALPSLKQGKSFVYKNGWLGVGMSDADSGAIRINLVADDSPAKKAGLLMGDVITVADGRKIALLQDVRDAIRAHDPGEKVKFLVRRAGKEIEVEVVLGKNPDL